MKQKKEVIDARRTQLIEILRNNKTVQVQELSRTLQVSLPTVRRDLDYLYKNHIVDRFYGGASLNTSRTFAVPEEKNERVKHALAKYAASQISDNDIVFINTSSTALLALKYMGNKKVTIITNNANAIHTEHSDAVQVILTGGELRIPKYSMVGDVALGTLRMVKANKCILGFNGISAQSGLTTRNMMEVSINEMMISNCSGPVMVVAPSHKVGLSSSFTSASIDRIHMLITDIQADPAETGLIAEHNVQIVKLDPLTYDF